MEEVRLQASQLKQSKEQLQLVFEASPNSIVLYKVIYSEDGKVQDFEFLMLNAFNINLVGVSYAMIGIRFSKEFPEVNKIDVLCQFRKTAETGFAADFEVWHDGEGLQHWFHFRAAKLNDLLIVTSENITYRKKAEETPHSMYHELELSSSTIRQMLDCSIASICILESLRDKKREHCRFYIQRG